MTSDGTVIASHRRRAPRTDAARTTANSASTSTDNTVTFDTTPPDGDDQPGGRAGRPDQRVADQLHGGLQRAGDRTSRPGDVTLSGTAGATTATVTGSGTTYNVAVSGMTAAGHGHRGRRPRAWRTGCGRQRATMASTSTRQHGHAIDDELAGPSRSTRRRARPIRPTPSPINFTVVFSEPVTRIQRRGGCDALAARPGRRRQRSRAGRRPTTWRSAG